MLLGLIFGHGSWRTRFLVSESLADPNICKFFCDFFHKSRRLVYNAPMKHIIGNTYTTTIGYTDIGIYKAGNSAVLIDTGSEVCKSLPSLLDQLGVFPSAVIHTHLHIDHVASNDLLCERYGCRIYASAEEIQHNEWSGDPRINPDDGDLPLVGATFRILPLRGHSIGHQAVVTPDGVCFLGDAVMSIDNLNTTKMPYHLNIQQAIRSMERIRELDFPAFVLAHSGIHDQESVREIVEANLQRESEYQEEILHIAGQKNHANHLVTRFMDHIGISRDKQAISWVENTAAARIRELERQGRLSPGL